MSNHCIIMTSVPNKEIADKISKRMLENRLVACIQKQKIESSYVWQDEIVNDSEILLLLKTKQERYPEIEKTIQELHPYEVPEILAVDVVKGLDKYLKWLDEVVQ
ncbi:MAG: divalent-cation tolerance protein CutA [Eubacteriales bacterium]|nr:divalent-cation tolerance protein CutA [Eubacteriales bacterium]